MGTVGALNVKRKGLRMLLAMQKQTVPHIPIIICSGAVDYMHCACEGVVEQLLNSWFSQDKPYFIGNRIEEVDKESLSIQPISEVTRTPRSIVAKKDWKG